MSPTTAPYKVDDVSTIARLAVELSRIAIEKSFTPHKNFTPLDMC
jgi:hypothetical protein